MEKSTYSQFKNGSMGSFSTIITENYNVFASDAPPTFAKLITSTPTILSTTIVAVVCHVDGNTTNGCVGLVVAFGYSHCSFFLSMSCYHEVDIYLS